MGTANIPEAVDGTVHPTTHHNGIRSALMDNLVPRNASANAADEAGNLGTSAYRWLIGYIKSVFIGSVANNISIEASGNDCIVKVGGNERLRIPVDDGVIPPGVIWMYSGTVNPSGWLGCSGEEVSRTIYANLFAAIGTTYGQGNGTTTFTLPDLRGRFIRGSDNMGLGPAGRDPDAATRTAMATGGNTGANVGSIQGDQNKAHTHSYFRPNFENINTAADAGSVATGDDAAVTGSEGGESRPINVNMNFIIKY